MLIIKSYLIIIFYIKNRNKKIEVNKNINNSGGNILLSNKEINNNFFSPRINNNIINNKNIINNNNNFKNEKIVVQNKNKFKTPFSNFNKPLTSRVISGKKI